MPMRHPPHRRRLPALLGLTACLAAGCIGDIGDPGEGGPGPENGPLVCDDGNVHVAVRPLRRLSSVQYVNTVRDLFGDPDFDAELDEGEDIISEREVRQLRDAAEAIIDRSSSWTRPVYPCDISGAGSDSCVSDFIDGFATRAYRRPLTDAERAKLVSVFQTARETLSFEESMQTLLQVVMQSPGFLYMFEAGSGDSEDGVRALSSHEVASRLSYFLWNTMPDDELMGVAESGELEDPTVLSAEADRLLRDPRAEYTVQRFMSGWLQLDGGVLHNALEETEKDATLYPEYSPELRAAMRTETEAFIRRTFLEEDGTLEDLFSAKYAYVNGPLAALYGVPGPSDADTWEWVELDGAERGGLLTRAAFLTVLSTKNVTAPIRRGVWVLEEMMCTELGEPPANANNVAVEGGVVDGELLSVREDVALRTGGDGCSSCHSVINPIGFTFEHYDAIGRWQTSEVTSGLPVDASGTIATSGDVDGDVEGALELSSKLAGSSKVRGCFADRWYRQALGGEISDLDQCSLEEIQARYSAGGSMRELVLGIVTSDAFRYLNTAETEQ